MNLFKVTWNILSILGIFFAIKIFAQTTSEDKVSGEKLFMEGKFEKAELHYKNVLNSDSKNFDALLRLGNISLLKNKHLDAEKFLIDALALKPKNKEAMQLLAEVYYRQDKFEKAAPFFGNLGEDAVAKKLESFKGVVPYQVDEEFEIAHIKFVDTDPLPLIEVEVNDQPANFIIDTGGSEVYVDPKLLKEAGGVDFGTTMGLYGGGKQALTGHGKIDKLTMADLTIRNVPVHILDTTRFSAATEGHDVHGIIGTVLFYHFIPTIDYPAGKLILQRKTPGALKALENVAGQIVIPFWMAGDHFIVSWGRVNDGEPQLFFVDTGLAGGGFVPSESTFKESGIQLTQEGFEGIGGGGNVSVVPFVVQKLSLGEAVEKNITGFYGPFPPQLELREGFRIGGIISHQFFRSYSVTFDFEGMRLFLRKKQS
jgi:hypothetical protein